MQSRRKFIVQGGLTTAALVATKPFSSLAAITSPFTSSSLQHITFIHTASSAAQVASGVKKLAYDHRNPVCLHSGKSAEELQPASYDASLSTLPENFEGKYKIINKGGIRVGIIEAAPNGLDTAEKINQLAASLKTEQHCGLVVCLSQLGFSNRSLLDDNRLAASSQHIDVIIGKETGTSPRQPFIAPQ